MKKFNKAQQIAIEHGDGPMMVLAGPGSGKTTVLVNRVLYLTRLLKVPEESILVITFTRAAAREMEERYHREKAKLDQGLQRETPGRGATFGTFHSVFFSFLRERLGYSHENVAEGRQCLELMWQVLKGREFRDHGLTTDMADLLLSELGSRKNGIAHRDHPLKESLMERISGAYELRLRQSGVLDFDDMLIRFLELLRHDSELLMSLRRRFRYIMVDEFQDINPTQYAIIRLLCEPLRNIFIVGDDDQSIYGFRGSDPSIMLGFPRDFPELRSVTLSVNYRSERSIVEASLRLIGHNKNRFQKELAPSPEHMERRRRCVRLKSFRTEEAEARFIVSDIVRRLERGQEPGEIAVLYRVHKASLTLKRALSEAGLSGCSIQLMSFHGAKGLEFDTVYIIAANEGITPWKAAKAAELEEERRMFYVAMTRARYELHIFNTKTLYSRTQIRSRYIAELSGRLLMQLKDKLIMWFNETDGGPFYGCA